MDFMLILGGLVVVIWIIAQVNFYLGHSEEHKSTLRLQVLCGLPLLAYSSWAYWVSDWTNFGTLYLFGCYCSLCVVYNGFHNFLTRSGRSDDFGEYFLFGWYKADNFLNEILVGGIMCYCCFQGYISSSTYISAAVEASKPAAHIAQKTSHAHTKSRVHAVTAHHK